MKKIDISKISGKHGFRRSDSYGNNNNRFVEFSTSGPNSGADSAIRVLVNLDIRNNSINVSLQGWDFKHSRYGEQIVEQQVYTNKIITTKKELETRIHNTMKNADALLGW